MGSRLHLMFSRCVPPQMGRSRFALAPRGYSGILLQGVANDTIGPIKRPNSGPGRSPKRLFFPLHKEKEGRQFLRPPFLLIMYKENNKQASVIQRSDSTIHRIGHFPVHTIV